MISKREVVGSDSRVWVDQAIARTQDEPETTAGFGEQLARIPKLRRVQVPCRRFRRPFRLDASEEQNPFRSARLTSRCLSNHSAPGAPRSAAHQQLARSR